RAHHSVVLAITSTKATSPGRKDAVVVLAPGARSIPASRRVHPGGPVRSKSAGMKPAAHWACLLAILLLLLADQAREPTLVLGLLAGRLLAGRAGRARRRALLRARLAHRHLAAHFPLHTVRLIRADRLRHLDAVLLTDPAAGSVR